MVIILTVIPHCNRDGPMMAKRERAQERPTMTIMRDEILEQAGIVARLAAEQGPY
jgi:hypothetical protein